MKNIILIVLLCVSTLFASNEAILKLDTQGHTGAIKDIVVDNRGNIISASDDKTIRVWNPKTGKEIEKILGQIGDGMEGMIYAIALSHNNKYLAVGGYLSYKNRNYGDIRIYNYKTKQLIKVLKSHTDVVQDLAFSSDDSYLVSGSADKSVKVWQSGTWSLEDTINTHTNRVYSVGALKRGGVEYVVSVGFDNRVSLYNLNSKKEVNSHTLDYKLQYLALSERYIAVSGFSNEITIYDTKLNHIKIIKSDTKPAGLKFSPDGAYLIAGRASTPNNVNIYNTKEFSLHSSFQKHTNLTKAVNFLDNKTAVSGGGNNNEIYIWDIDTLKVKKEIVGVGDSVWSVGLKGDRVAWGNVWTGDSHTIGSKFQKSIDLNNFAISKDISNFNRVATTYGNYSLSHRAGGYYGMSDAVLDIKRDGKRLNSITRGSTDGYRHNCYGWYKEYIISGGSNGHLKVYNRDAEVVAELIGHTRDVWSIAVDGDRLVSGGDDQTIMVWNLKEIGSSKELKVVEANWFNKSWTDWITKNHPDLNINKESDRKELYYRLVKAGDSDAKKMIVNNSQQLHPILNLFVSQDDEWIAWSKSGYFASSVGGDKYVGYHINQGAEKEARYVGSDKYFDTLYRPDIIANILVTGSEKKAIAYAKKTQKVQTVDIAKSLPPVVRVLSESYIDTKADSVTIKYQIQSDEPVQSVIITQNGVKIDTRGLKIAKKESGVQSVVVDLTSGENIIAIKAKNRFAMSDEVLVRVNKKSNVADIYKPTLYLLSVGVSEYEDNTLNLGVADKDAQAIAKMFMAQKGKIYKDVHAKEFTNKKATSDNILDGLDWLDKEVTSKDVAIIFIAGHGVNDDKGEYYFLSHDANTDRLRRTAVPWYELQRTISNLPSKTILLADTCHSGNIAGTRRDVTSAIKSIINSGTGSIIMTATTGYSYEQSDWGHGAFTKSLVEGLEDAQADYDRDGTVTVKEIDLYVTNRVKKLTDGKQKPTTIIPASIPDFALGVK
jgi:WD40 repeat protein